MATSSRSGTSPYSKASSGTNVDKSIYGAPKGLSELGSPSGQMLPPKPQGNSSIDSPDPLNPTVIEIEIEDPENLSEEDAALIDAMNEGDIKSPDHDDNLADYLSEDVLGELAKELIADYDRDRTDRKEWIETYLEGKKLLGLKYEMKTDPWEDACGVYHPMLAESVVRFQSEAMMETFPAAGPVKTAIVGRETPEKVEAAARVREDMNYLLMECMPEYRTEHEKLLWALPLTGSAFKKVYYDPAKGRQVSMFVPAEDVIVPYGASNLQTAERVTHIMRKTKNELAKMVASGFYIDAELDDPTGELDEIDKSNAEQEGITATQDLRYRLLEMQVDLDLPGFKDRKKDKKTGEEKDTGVALPYIVTIEKSSARILSVRRNWYEEDERKCKRDHLVHYQYIPGPGFYGYGLIHLVGGYTKSATMILRELVDAGTLANLPGGLKTKGLRVTNSDEPIAPGEFRDVDVPSGSIRDNILPLPYKDPSATLFALFQNVVQEGRAFASAGDLKVADMSAQAPVGTTLAILERTLKVMSAVQARLHYAMKLEFKLLRDIIRDSTPNTYKYEPAEGTRFARGADYDMVEVIPVSDPNAATMAQKIVTYQAALQLAQSAPQLYDMQTLHRQMIEVLGLKNAAKLIPTPEDMVPMDPVTENQNLLNGKPVKAFLEQHHEAHIQAHMAAMQNPKVQQLMAMNPNAPAIQAAAMAHINEHVALQYRRDVEQQIGILPTEEENKKITPAQAERIAIAAAKATAAITGRDQAEIAAQQQQAAAQDPVLAVQMQELEVKKKAEETKEKKVVLDAAAKADDLRIKEKALDVQMEIAAMQVGATSAAARDKAEREDQREGVRIGADIAKHKADLEQRSADAERQAAMQHQQGEQQAQLHREDRQENARQKAVDRFHAREKDAQDKDFQQRTAAEGHERAKDMEQTKAKLAPKAKPATKKPAAKKAPKKGS